MEDVIISLIEKFKEKPYLLYMGKGELSRRLKVTKEQIVEARNKIKDQLGCKLYTYIKEHPLVNNEKPEEPEKKQNFPKILILDIETSPLLAWVWGRWKQDIHLEQTVAEWFIISWAAKWFLSDEIMSDVLTSEEIINQDDERIIYKLWKLIDDADILVFHNGLAFDLPKMNSRFIIHELQPPSSFRTIDTKLIAAKQFGFSSNKLDALAEYFGFKKKLHTGFELWANCMKGDKQSLLYMEEYNRNDVVILEEIYIKLRPWIRSHPNVGLYMEEEVMICSSCGNKSLTYLSGKYYTTQISKYPLFRCNSCGALTRGRRTELPKELNSVLGTSIPK